MNVAMGVASFGPFIWHTAKAVMCEFFVSRATASDALVKDMDGMQDVFNQNPMLRRDIKLVSMRQTLYPAAVGTNHDCAGASVLVNLDIYAQEPAGTRYLVKKELYTIRHSTLVKDQVAKAVGTLFTAFVCLIEAASTGIVMPISALIGMEYMLDYHVSRRWEDQARRFAVKAATNDELIGAMQIFMAFSKAKNLSELPYDAKFVEEEIKVRKIQIAYNQTTITKLAKTIKNHRVFV